MCPRNKQQGHYMAKLKDMGGPWKPSETGSMDSIGVIGGPSLSDPGSATLVRQHRGLSSISVGSLILNEKRPAIFSASKPGGSDEYMVTLSCAMTSTQYAVLISALEKGPGLVGTNVSVVVSFVPTSPNEVQRTTAPSI